MTYVAFYCLVFQCLEIFPVSLCSGRVYLVYGPWTPEKNVYAAAWDALFHKCHVLLTDDVVDFFSILADILSTCSISCSEGDV